VNKQNKASVCACAISSMLKFIMIDEKEGSISRILY